MRNLIAGESRNPPTDATSASITSRTGRTILVIPPVIAQQRTLFSRSRLTVWVCEMGDHNPFRNGGQSLRAFGQLSQTQNQSGALHRVMQPPPCEHPAHSARQYEPTPTFSVNTERSL